MKQAEFNAVADIARLGCAIAILEQVLLADDAQYQKMRLVIATLREFSAEFHAEVNRPGSR